MKRSRLLTLIALAALALAPFSMNVAVAQSDDQSVAAPAGTEYYVAFMQNEDQRGAATRFMGLMITSDVATFGQVEIPGSGTQTFTTQPGQATTITVPRTLEMKYGEEPPLPAIHITSRAPISVFVLNSLYQSSGGYAALPVELWRSTYLPMSLPNADGERVGEFMIVAAYDTRVTIAPSTQTNFRDAWQSIDVNLKKGESYLVQARPGTVGVSDLSTSEISATRPIGVIAGHMRTPISPNRSISSDLWASHQAVMLLSDSLWGNDYYTVPMRAVPDRFRLTPAFDNTAIEVTHYPEGKSPEHAVITLDRGDIFDSSTINGRPISGPVHWTSTKPFILMQMRTSGGYGDAANSPIMLPAVALDQFSSHSTFVAPAVIGSNAITSNTLTVVAKGNPSDLLGSLNNIMLDGKSLATVDASAAWKSIDQEIFYITLSIPAGGHVLNAPDGVRFAANINGNDGSLGDFYSWNVPFWVPATESDVTAPRIVENLPSPGKGKIAVRISDRTSSYFSGVENVTLSNSPGWRLSSQFVSPYPDADVDVTFETVADPSGPLSVDMRDRNGNVATVKLSDGICTKTAYADREKIVIQTNQGRTVRDSVIIRANPCGDAAQVLSVNKGTGNAANYLDVAFNQGTLPVAIASNSLENLYFTVHPDAPQGTHYTTVTLTVDSGTIVLPVELDVAAPASVSHDEGTDRFAMTLAPNPFNASVRIDLGRAMSSGAQITISDYLGRTVRSFSGDELAGRTEATWNGTDDRGIDLPAGVYIVTALDGKSRSVRTATLIR